jgi:hypothetical protein
MNKLKKPQDATLKDVLALRRQMDDIIFNGNLNDETIDALRVYTEPFRDNVVSVLKSAPNGAQYTQMTEFLKGNSKNIIEAKRLLKSNNIQAFDNYLKSLMAPTGTASATKGFMDEMASQSPLAAKQLELIKNNEAAKSFMEIAPSMKNLQSGAGLIVGGATYAATQDGNVSALAALPLTSPRTALKAAVLASKTAKVASGLGQRAQAILPSLYNAKEVITRLATSEKAKLLQDPRALGAILGPLVNDINNSQGNEGQ